MRPSNLLGDLRVAARSLSHRPGFVAAGALTLAFGLGVNVAVFSLFQQILLQPLPVPEPERLVNLTSPEARSAEMSAASSAGGLETVFSYPMFRDLEREQEAFVGIAAHRAFDASVSTGQQARATTGSFVSGSYFSVLGLRPAVGRLLNRQDDQIDGQAESVVLSYAYWQSEFGGDEQVVGRTLTVNRTALTIVGVAPRGFHGTTVGTRASIFVPITFPGATIPDHDNRRVYWVHLFARLVPGVDREEATATINPVYRGILSEIEAPLLTEFGPQELETFRTRSLVLEPGARGQSALLAPLGERLRMLLVASGLVLLLCCANVAGLILVRGSGRGGEMALRASLGASRARLSAFLLAESLLLAVPAALLSLPVALLTLRGIASGVPGIPSSAFDISLSLSASVVAIAVAVLSALIFGLLPIRGLLRVDPRQTLHVQAVRHTSGKGVTRFRAALATVQLALSMALLATTGMLAESLANIARIDLGFDVESVVAFSISPQASGYSRDASATLFDRLEEDLATIPGVSAAASSMTRLLSGRGMSLGGIAVADVAAEGPVSANIVSPNFFRTLGIELLAGSEFRADQSLAGGEVAIVNQRFAQRFGVGEDIIGQEISRPNSQTRIVGLVGDAKYGSVTDEIEPQIFLSRSQQRWIGSATFYVRSARPAQDLVAAVSAVVSRADPLLPMTEVTTMEQQVRESLATERFITAGSTALAVLATALSALGLYGVLAYSVAQRSREIGLRIALGAQPGSIRGLILRQVAAMALAGLALGVPAAWILGRAASSLLVGVEAGDPQVLAGAAAVLTIVALAVSYHPARRAALVDPMSALRYE